SDAAGDLGTSRQATSGTRQAPQPGNTSIVLDLPETRGARRVKRHWPLSTAAGAILLVVLLGFFLTLAFRQSASTGSVSRAHKEISKVAAGKPTKPRVAKPGTFEAWLEEVADLPAQEQVDAVLAKLRERNPNFDGLATRQVKDGVVTWLEFRTHDVTDIAPVRALQGLKNLKVHGTEERKG